MSKHAYMIIAHNQFELLEKLILALDDERNVIFVHIDAKVKNFDFEHFSHLTHYSKVIFTDNRINITWGDSSQVQCEMLLLKTAVKYNDPQNPFTYYHLISGVDLPIKTNDYIHHFFDKNNGKEFVHFTADTVSDSSVTRIKYYHFFRKKRNLFNKIIAQIALKSEVLLKVNRLKNKNIAVQKGCNWFSITGDFAAYIVDHLSEYEKLFRWSYCADEVFIQTLLVNSDFKNNLYMPECNNDHRACMRLIDWRRGNPYVWRISDLEEILTSDCIFARKFDLNADSKIVDAILNSIKQTETE